MNQLHNLKFTKRMMYTRVRDVKNPSRGTDKSAGIDFFVPNDIKPIKLMPHDSALIPSGVHVRPSKGTCLIAFNKSGVATKKGLIVGACVVDEDYQGEVHLHVINVSASEVFIEPGEKLIQFVQVETSYANPCEVVPADLYLSKTARGTGGFGSTNSKNEIRNLSQQGDQC